MGLPSLCFSARQYFFVVAHITQEIIDSEYTLEYLISNQVAYSFTKFWSLVLLLDSGTIIKFGTFLEPGTFDIHTIKQNYY